MLHPAEDGISARETSRPESSADTRQPAQVSGMPDESGHAAGRAVSGHGGQPPHQTCGRMQPGAAASTWNIRYFLTAALLALLWFGAYSHLDAAARWLVGVVPGIDSASRSGAALEFFLADTAKILLLLLALIYGIAWLRIALTPELARERLAGTRRWLGYALGALFGAITPFCSCSSIPLFIGFTTARIPVGITMAFLITSPLINEIALVLLWGLLGWKFTALYVAVGLGAGCLGGLVMDALKAGRWLQPSLCERIRQIPARQLTGMRGVAPAFTVRQRHAFALGETVFIFRRVWKWVLAGVALGALVHGFVPADWFAEHLGSGEWWSVPAAVLVGIPLYSNVTGIVPVMQSLLLKGLPLGTTLAFCMSAVAASLPEMMLLRQIMTPRLQLAFLGYLWVMFTLVGWLFNCLGPYLG